MSLDGIADLMFVQMNEDLTVNKQSSCVMPDYLIPQVKVLFQRYYERFIKSKGDPEQCPYYEFEEETILPGVIRLTVKHIFPARSEILA